MNIGDLFFTLRADGKTLQSDITKQAGIAGDKAGATMGSRMGRALKVGIGVGVGLAAAVAVRGLTGAINSGVASLRELGVVEAQTNAVIKSTGNAARVTTKHIRELSERTEDLTTIDDKVVQAGANMLLTFTNVRNEVGAGNDIFDQSIGVLADMSTALGSDMPKAAIQLGKALNDPVKGITALTRVGVTFDADQKKRIKQFVAEGKVIEAQRIILAELNKEFGGSGAAFAATDAGKAAKFADAIEGIQMSLARALLPAITRVQEALTKFLSNPETMAQAERLGEMIASIFSEGNLKTAASLMTTAANAIGTAFKLFGQLPKELQALAVGALVLKKFTGIGPLDIVKTIGGELFKRGGSPANPLFVSDVAKGLGGGLPGRGGIGNILKVAIVGAVIVEGLNLWMQSLQDAADKNNDLADKGLNAAEIEAVKYYQGDAAWQQAQLKHLGRMPSREDFESGIAKLNANRGVEGTEQFGPPTPPELVGAASDAAKKADLAAILERAVKAGFKPSADAIQATYERNKQHLIDIKVAAKNAGQQAAFATRDVEDAVIGLPLRLKNALGGILFGGRAPGKEEDDRNVGLPPKPKQPASPKTGAINPGGGVKVPMRAAGGPVTAGVPYWVGEHRKPELFVPRVSGSVVPLSNIQAGGSGSGSGSFNPTINIEGLIPYRDPFTIATELKRLRDFVVVTPRREPA